MKEDNARIAEIQSGLPQKGGRGPGSRSAKVSHGQRPDKQKHNDFGHRRAAPSRQRGIVQTFPIGPRRCGHRRHNDSFRGAICRGVYSNVPWLCFVSANGQLTSSELTTVISPNENGKPPLQLSNAAAAAYLSMKAAAAQAGIALSISTPGGGYRSLWMQQDMKDHPGDYHLNIDPGDLAAPGGSTHGYGTALDISTSAANNWAIVHCGEFGFNRESPAGELNHYRYIGAPTNNGDIMPYYNDKQSTASLTLPDGVATRMTFNGASDYDLAGLPAGGPGVYDITVQMYVVGLVAGARLESQFIMQNASTNQDAGGWYKWTDFGQSASQTNLEHSAKLVIPAARRLQLIVTPIGASVTIPIWSRSVLNFN